MGCPLLATSTCLHIRQLALQAARRVIAERSRAQRKHNVASESFIIRKASARNIIYSSEDEEERTPSATNIHAARLRTLRTRTGAAFHSFVPGLRLVVSARAGV